MAVARLLAQFSWTGLPIAYRFAHGLVCWRCASRRQHESPLGADNVFGPSIRCRDCDGEILSVDAAGARKHADW